MKQVLKKKDVETPTLYETFGDLSIVFCSYDVCHVYIAAGKNIVNLRAFKFKQTYQQEEFVFYTRLYLKKYGLACLT